MSETTPPARILVVGSTGPLGLAFTQLALERGLEVVSLARRLMPFHHERLNHIQGDVADPAVAKQAATCGADAAFISLGLFHWRDSTVLSDGTRSLIQAVVEHGGPPRILCVTSLGAGDSYLQGNWFSRLFQRLLLRSVLIDKNRQEEVIRRSGLRWTILRPSGLVDTDLGRKVVLWTGEAPDEALAWRVSRSDVARVALEFLQKDLHVGEAVQIST